MEGIYLINKPTGVSSRDAGELVKNSLSLSKIGHVGTLDLEASGLLLLLSGRATRLQNYFLEADKVYAGEIILGKKSTTDDIFGEVVDVEDAERILGEINKEEFLTKVVSEFSPGYLQMPPHVSAKKIDGKKSLKEFKKGNLLTLSKKEVAVEFLKFEFTDLCTIKYEIKVSTGFYVRALARDVGNLLGIGGITKSIRRVRIGAFNVEDALDLEAIRSFDFTAASFSNSSFFFPLHNLFNFLKYPVITVDDAGLRRAVLNGNVATLQKLFSENLKGTDEVRMVIKDGTGAPLGIVNNFNDTCTYEYVLSE